MYRYIFEEMVASSANVGDHKNKKIAAIMSSVTVQSLRLLFPHSIACLIPQQNSCCY